MNKKFLSAILFGALMVTSTGTFVSCKDYDDDIDSLQEQIDKNVSAASTNAEAIKGIQTQLSTLQSALSTAQSTADSAVKAAADAAAAAKAAQATGDDALAQAKAAQAAADAASAAAAQAKADAIAKAIEEVEALKAWVEQGYATKAELEAASKAQAAALAEASAKIEAIEAGLSILDEDLNQMYAGIQEQINTLTQTATNNIVLLQEELAIQQATLDKFKAIMEELKAGDEELWVELDNVKNSLNATITQLNNLLQDQIDELWSEVALTKEELYGAITALNNIHADDKAAFENELTEILKTQETLTAQLSALYTIQSEDKKAIDNEIAEILKTQETLTAQLSALYTIQSEDKEAIDNEITEIYKAQEGLSAQLSALLNTHNEDITALEETLYNEISEVLKTQTELSSALSALVTIQAEDKAELTKAIEDAKTALSTALASEIAAVNTALETNVNEIYAKIAEKDSEFRTEIQKVYNEITTLSSTFSGNLATLKTFVKGRLTSMLFAPTFYVDGIEAIPFDVLKYTPWIDLKMDAADGEGTITLSDGSTPAEYFVSPSNIDVESIEELNVLLSNATNVSSRAAGDKVTATLVGIENGKMKVNLKKNTTETFAGKGDEFTIMALQAVVKGVEEGDETALVTSDWARIYESQATPYIHTTDTTVAEADVHFWNYNTAIKAEEGELVVKEVNYNESLDLHELVTVCVNERKLTAENIAAYGMKFGFALVDEYTLKADEEEETKQANFAVIDENGVITSRANDNTTANNRDAIGREPLVQVTLIDTNNENKIVDVKYFKIKWTAVTNSVDLKELAKFTVDYACDSTYADTVKTDIMNAIYTKLEMSKEEFHVMYKPDNFPNGFIVRNAEGEVVTDCGEAIQVTAEGSTKTYNIAWHGHGPVTITKEEWEAGKAVRTIYLKYVNQANPAETISFSLTREFNIEGMDLVGGYVQTYWTGTLASSNADKMFQVNPALTTDKAYGNDKYETCRIITNLLHGYNVTGIAADDLTIKDIVSENVSGAKFVFDAERAAEMNEAWTVSEDGTILKVDGENAAAISVVNNRAYIKLYETNNYTVATEAAKSLVGKKVPVKLVAEHCSKFTTVLDSYLVHFIEPLAATLNMAKGQLQDLWTGGATLPISTAITVSEKFGEKRPVVYVDEDGKLAVNEELYGWYAVEPSTWDLAEATTNLNIDGNNLVITGAFDTKFSEHADKYQLEVVKDENGNPTELKFHNNSGTHIQQAFKVRIPVYVATKWNSKLTTEPNYVEVEIVPGVTE